MISKKNAFRAAIALVIASNFGVANGAGNNNSSVANVSDWYISGLWNWVRGGARAMVMGGTKVIVGVRSGAIAGAKVGAGYGAGALLVANRVGGVGSLVVPGGGVQIAFLV